jgi:uncharacterized protein (TIGR02231 family)
VLNGLCFLLLAAPAPHPVTEVVVYPEGALVTRRAAIACAPGQPRVVDFPALPASADVESLQAEAAGARVVAVRWDRPRPPAGEPPAARALARVREELAAVEQRLERGDGAGERADGYEKLVERWAGRALWRTGAAPAKWAGAVEAVLDERLTLAREQQGARARLRSLQAEAANLARRLETEQKARELPPVTGHVHLACTGTSATVALRYLAAGAGWKPVYEVRARERVLELAAWATVHQSTGEPWPDVRLSLSTARPGERATPPAFSPLRVWSEAHEEPKQIVAGTEEIAEAPTARIHGGIASQRIQFIDRGGLATDMVVPGKAQVPADGTAVRVLVARTRHAARLRLRTAPRLSPAAYRIAELVNDTPFPLLPGRLEMFREATFVGAQELHDEVPIGARLVVSFGVEDRVRVSRLVVRELERAAGLFSGARHHLFAYRFHVANHLAGPEEIEVVDHIPISQLDDVSVLVEPATTRGYTLEPRDGTVTWRLSLRSGEEKAFELAFRVEVPSAYQ